MFENWNVSRATLLGIVANVARSTLQQATSFDFFSGAFE